MSKITNFLDKLSNWLFLLAMAFTVVLGAMLISQGLWLIPAPKLLIAIFGDYPKNQALTILLGFGLGMIGLIGANKTNRAIKNSSEAQNNA